MVLGLQGSVELGILNCSEGNHAWCPRQSEVLDSINSTQDHPVYPRASMALKSIHMAPKIGLALASAGRTNAAMAVGAAVLCQLTSAPRLCHTPDLLSCDAGRGGCPLNHSSWSLPTRSSLVKEEEPHLLALMGAGCHHGGTCSIPNWR